MTHRTSRLPLAAAAAAATAVSLAAAATAGAQVTPTTVTFQNGADGYTGTTDRVIGFEGAAGTPAPTPSAADADGSTAEAVFLDGNAANEIDRKDLLIRFDNLIGPAAVPAGATILDAQYVVRTPTTTNAQSGGSFNVYRLARPFDANSSASGDFNGGEAGIAVADGDVDLLSGTFDRPAAGSFVSADVSKIVQSWAGGATNHGFGVKAETTDGWSVNATGAADPANRPRLAVTYTTQPNVVSRRFQQGVNGYTGGGEVFLNRGGDESANGTLTGATATELFIDGQNAAVTEPDNPAIVSFAGLTAAGTGINPGDRVVKAQLVIYSGASSANADSGGPFTVHQVLRSIDANTAYASLDSDGDPNSNLVPELIGGGWIGPEAARFTSISDDEVVTVDVSGIVQSWLDGAPNLGVYLGVGTTDGWQVFTSGALDANFRPELWVVTAPVPEPGAIGLFAVAGLGLLRRRRRRGAGSGR